MRKYSLPLRVAALLCALCLLLTGCGSVAAPDNSGDTSTPAPTAEPTAEEVPTTLPTDVALPKGNGAYKVLDECPEEFSRRELSDEEIRAIAQDDLETARERISTGHVWA